MAPLDWVAERFPPHGALSAEGFGKLLGRPSLDALTVLVRETTQNSWDTRLPRATVRYSLDFFVLDDEQRQALDEEVFRTLPPAGLPLGASLEQQELGVLVISDRRTLGLGGPTRADKPTDGPRDYVNLVMNVGVGGREYGGGTYGFGKTIAYIVSRARTVVVHSRTSNGLTREETRLIASGVGEPFVHRRASYTGRHWWGRDKAGTPEPITGRSADHLARQIGLPGFDEGTGTSIMVIDPDFGGRTPADAMRFMSEAITWNLWPKMVKVRGRQPMRFSVSCQGQDVPVVRPESLPPLHGFAASLEALHAHDGPLTRDDGLELLELRSQRPSRRLGRLALYNFVAKPRPLVPQPAEVDLDDAESTPTSAAPFSGPSHHVALLRAPELIVTYMTGPEIPDPAVEWGGVFLCDHDLDNAFAGSEPPTHDDWQPSLLPDKRDRRLVNIALREIRNAVRDRALGAGGSPVPGRSSPAIVAEALRGLVAGIPGTGAGHGPRGSGAGKGPGPRRPRVSDLTCGPILVGNERRSRATFSVANPTDSVARLTIRAGVATNDGTGIEQEPPAGSTVPEIVEISGPESVTVGTEGASVLLPPRETSEWTVLATSPDDVMVAFDLRVELAGETT